MFSFFLFYDSLLCLEHFIISSTTLYPQLNTKTVITNMYASDRIRYGIYMHSTILLNVGYFDLVCMPLIIGIEQQGR